MNAAPIAARARLLDQLSDLGIASCCRQLTSSLAITILDSLVCTVFEQHLQAIGETSIIRFAGVALQAQDSMVQRGVARWLGVVYIAAEREEAVKRFGLPPVARLKNISMTLYVVAIT